MRALRMNVTRFFSRPRPYHLLPLSLSNLVFGIYVAAQKERGTQTCALYKATALRSYQATVKVNAPPAEEQMPDQTYLGVTEPEWKLRHANHEHDFKKTCATWPDLPLKVHLEPEGQGDGGGR